MQLYERECLRRELDEKLLPFRLVPKRKGKVKEGWIKSVRQAVGMPVEQLAEELGVSRWEIHRMEDAEKNSRIMLATLKRAAEGLGCELVYALRPKKGTLADMAAGHTREHERVMREKQWQRELQRKPWLEAIGWREKFWGVLRTKLRAEGFRVRPRTTERGVEKQMEEFRQALELVKLADVMGPAMKELQSKAVGQLGEGNVE